MTFHPIRGEKIGQSDKEETDPQTIHRSRRQIAQAAFEGKNACIEAREADEEIGRISEAEGWDARHWPRPSALASRIRSSPVSLQVSEANFGFAARWKLVWCGLSGVAWSKNSLVDARGKNCRGYRDTGASDGSNRMSSSVVRPDCWLPAVTD
jgi:hypothetical protein